MNRFSSLSGKKNLQVCRERMVKQDNLDIRVLSLLLRIFGESVGILMDIRCNLGYSLKIDTG
jgi:hypothetical protein